MPILLGQVGWDTDDSHFNPGEPTNDGHTLVKCQLWSGRDKSKPHTPDRAQGKKLTCHLSDGVFRVPAKNTRCYIAIPDGMEDAAGAGVIIATVSPGPEIRRNINPGDLVLSAPGGGQAQITIKASGSIMLSTTHNNLPVEEGGQLCCFELSNDTEGRSGGLAYSSPIGSWTHTKLGFRIKDTASGTRIEMGGMSLFGVPSDVTSALSGFFMVTAPQIKLKGASVRLGSGPSYNCAIHASSAGLQAGAPATPITMGPTYQSASVWITVP